jgi:hypothetical protein
LVFISQSLADERTTRTKYQPSLKTAAAEKPGGFLFLPWLVLIEIEKELR